MTTALARSSSSAAPDQSETTIITPHPSTPDSTAASHGGRTARGAPRRVWKGAGDGALLRKSLHHSSGSIRAPVPPEAARTGPFDLTPPPVVSASRRRLDETPNWAYAPAAAPILSRSQWPASPYIPSRTAAA